MPCAYCKGSEKLTREHIWPDCILKRLPTYNVRYAARAGKIISADLVVRDVCHICNNGSLSKLDAYFCKLYDEYFGREIGVGQPVIFKYDFDILAKALLKIAYNSARTTDVDTKLLERYAAIIISNNVSPIGLFIKLATIHATYISDRHGVDKLIPPRSTRCGPIEISNRSRNGIAARIIQIDSFRFYVCVTEDAFNRQLAVRYLANEAGIWLSRSGETVVPEPRLSALEALKGVQNWRKRTQ